MPLPKSIHAYNDCKEIYERAMDSVLAEGPGVRVRQPDWDAANYLRMRMNNARAINRRDNQDIYEPGDPLYKASEWDTLMVTIKKVGEEFYLYVEPHGIDTSSIEAIPEGEVATRVVVEKPAAVGEIQALVSRR